MIRQQTLNSGSSAPGTCEVIEVLLKNHSGEIKNIINLVRFIRISEHIQSPTLMIQMGISDSSNFFEEFELSGGEKISLKLQQKFFQGDKDAKVTNTIELDLYVVSYPDYARANDTQSQVYTILGMSHHAFIAPLKRISRAINRPLPAMLKSILIEDLAIPADKYVILGNPSSKYAGILNWTNPLNASLSLVKRISDEKNSPFFLFQRTNGNIYLAAHSYLVDSNLNPVYRTFVDQTRVISDNPNSVEFELEALTRIRSINSNFSLNRIDAATKGAYASEYNYIDTVYKTNTIKVFDYNTDFNVQNTLSQKNSFYSDYTVDLFGNLGNEQPLNKIPSAAKNFIFTNRLGGGNGKDTIATYYKNTAQIKNIFLENFNTCTHTIQVNGDFNLNCGRMIELKIPKATDMSVYKDYTGKTDTDEINHVLSGKYLIFAVEHMIENGNYISTMIVKKDAL